MRFLWQVRNSCFEFFPLLIQQYFELLFPLSFLLIVPYATSELIKSLADIRICIAEMKRELQAGIAETKHKLQAGIAETKHELQAGIAETNQKK